MGEFCLLNPIKQENDKIFEKDSASLLFVLSKINEIDCYFFYDVKGTTEY